MKINMADALDNIFSAIMKSEMIAHDGIQKHKEVKNAIEQLEMRLIKLESKKAEHAVKKSQLELAVADAIITVRILKTKEELGSYELKVVEEKVQLQKNRFNDLNKNMVDGYEEFIGTVKAFSSDYGLSSSGAQKRIRSTEENLRSLQAIKEKLESDVDAIDSFNDGLKRILDNKSKENMDLMKITGKIDDIDKEIDKEISCSHDLEKKISQLITEPDYDPEFVRVRKELQEYEVTELQTEIDKLQTELKMLTNKLRNKEARSLRLQYRHWQRQQNQKSVNRSSDQNENQRTTTPNFNPHFGNLDECEREETTKITDEVIKLEESP